MDVTILSSFPGRNTLARKSQCDRAKTYFSEYPGTYATPSYLFEMLSHWGNYSKEQALTWAWELCTEIYQIPPSRLVVSADERDTETIAIWRDKIGIPEDRIIISRWNGWRSNFGGHCGVSTRIHYDCHPERGYELAASEEDIEFRSKVKKSTIARTISVTFYQKKICAF
ncbi:MAG: hypothetical protein HC894_32520 [Microcoleus sp. SM1_3_4]|nr:hypothetical protein [Microcoleus sp. SM1_3_4]